MSCIIITYTRLLYPFFVVHFTLIASCASKFQYIIKMYNYIVDPFLNVCANVIKTTIIFFLQLLNQCEYRVKLQNDKFKFCRAYEQECIQFLFYYYIDFFRYSLYKIEINSFAKLSGISFSPISFVFYFLL